MVSITENDPSFSFLASSVKKDYFTFKMNIEPQISNPDTALLNQSNFEFLCDLIQQQHLYITELETRLKLIQEEYSKQKLSLDQKEGVLKSLNENIITTFMKTNYEQEQTINYLQQELESLKNSKQKTINSNVANSTMTTAREDNKSTASPRESSSRNVNANIKEYQTPAQTQIQSQNQSIIMPSKIGGKTKKGINVYLHKEKLKMMDLENSSSNTGMPTHTSMKGINTVSRNHSGKKTSMNLFTQYKKANKEKSGGNSMNTSMVKSKGNVNVSSVQGNIQVGSGGGIKGKKGRKLSSIH